MIECPACHQTMKYAPDDCKHITCPRDLLEHLDRNSEMASVRQEFDQQTARFCGLYRCERDITGHCAACDQ